ncbi:MAG: AMP-binding protein [Candidatus Sericytochromatia bacterium]|nr:AMP-binding protein [Candidatus Tanganyikabacteria bacterium]
MTDRMTIPELLAAQTARRAAAPLLLDALTGHARTYSEVTARACRWARFFAERGLAVGDRVAIALPNSLDFAEAYLGAAIAGVTLCPYNPALPDGEIANLSARFGARLMLTTPSRADDLAIACQIPLFSVGTRGDLPARLPEHGLPGPKSVAGIGPDTPIALILTSGTTGGTKACRITQAGACWTAEATAAAFALGPDSRYLTPLPLHHINAQVVGLLAAIRAGGAVAIGPRLPAAKLWESAARVQATALSLVPAILYDLLAQLPESAAPAATLRFVVCSSAPLPPTSRKQFEDRFGIPVVVCYGLSEASCFVSYGRPAPLEAPVPPGTPAPPGSVGIPIGCEVRIGEGGEILVRGPGVFDGYEGDPDATAAAVRDGWLHTGDVGAIEPGGHLVLHGRIKEMINRGGEKIAPDAVEAVLRECPGILDVAVFAVPDDRLGEEIAAAVVPGSGAGPSDDDLWDFCADRLADFETPRVWIRPVALPRGPTGKVLRRALQEEYVRCKAR